MAFSLAYRATHPPTECARVCAQAAQVRKSSYIGDKDLPYQPDAHHECTVFAGTIVRQVLHILPIVRHVPHILPIVRQVLPIVRHVLPIVSQVLHILPIAVTIC